MPLPVDHHQNGDADNDRHSSLQPIHSRNSSSSSMALFRINSDHRASRGGARRRRQLKLLASYGTDWLITLILAAVFFSLNEVHGFRREFSIDDKTISFPFAEHERVPDVALYMIAIVAPFVIQIGINVLTVRSFWDFHNSTLGLLLALALAGSITQFTKITVGRPRPDLLSRCNPMSGITNPEYGLVTDAICRQTDMNKLRDGFRSFPSGHSSLSFSGLGHLAFYTAGKLHLFDMKGHTTKAWISLTPLAGAALVAISRTMDYRHHWQDVLIGSLLGITMAFFAYRQYYPPLSSPRSHHPFSPRIPPNENGEDYPSSASDGQPILPLTRADGEEPAVTHPGAAGARTGDGEAGIGLTHPSNPIMPFGHTHTLSGSPYGERYRDDGDTDDLIHPTSSFNAGAKSDAVGIELNRT